MGKAPAAEDRSALRSIRPIDRSSLGIVPVWVHTGEVIELAVYNSELKYSLCSIPPSSNKSESLHTIVLYINWYVCTI